MPGLDDTEYRSWQHFLESALRVSATLNRELTDTHKVTLADLRLLDVLDHAPDGAARMGDLADAVLALPSRITRQIRRLEGHGLVARRASPEDGRGVLAAITADGRALVTKAMVSYGHGIQIHFLGHLTRSQVSSMGDSCGRLNAALRAHGSGY